MAITAEGLDVVGIGRFLSQNFLTVPPNQRSYAWEKEHVTDFWDDITRAIENNESDYFLGSIVLNKGERSLEVVDGQQRLATTVMIYGAVCDWLQFSGYKEHCAPLQKYLSDQDEQTLEELPKIILNDLDDAFFRQNVVNRTPDGRRTNPEDDRPKNRKRLKDSHKRIAEAAEAIRTKVYARAAGREPDGVQRLKRLLSYLGNNVKVICVTVPDNEHAYTIFETLNDRGLDLSKADLLKNHLYRTAKTRTKQVESQWSTMVGAIETVGKEAMVVDYIRYLLISERGHIREKDLYSNLRKSVIEQSQAVELANKLAENAVLYAAILNSDHSRWSKFGDETKANLSNLIMLGIERLHPITLAIVRRFTDAELKKAIAYLVGASVRIMIAGPAAGTVEQEIAKKAPLINNGSITTAKDLSTELVSGKVVPGDAAFEAAFAAASVKQGYLARYYLRTLDNAAEGDFAPVTKEQAKGTVEHIMPEKPDASWRIAPDIARGYLRRIGNLALFGAKENAAVGNQDFQSVKIPAYKKSGIRLTKEIGEGKYGTAWNKDQIEERQRDLAALAVKAWPALLKK